MWHHLRIISLDMCFTELSYLDAPEISRLYRATMLDQFPVDIFYLILQEVSS